jgi:tetratricopeptide (TPR) repeat protein
VGRVEEAITSLQQAVTIYRGTGDWYGEGIALANLGLALRQVGRVEEAIPIMQQAAAIFRQISDRYHEGIALDILVQALRRVHRFEEAITALEQAVAINHDISERRSEGTALTNLSLTLAEMGRFEEAQECAARALELFVAVEADEDALWARNLMERFTKTLPPTSSPPPARRWPLTLLRPPRTFDDCAVPSIIATSQ